MRRTLLLLPLFTLAVIFALSGCSSNNDPPPAGGTFSMSIDEDTLNMLNKPISRWMQDRINNYLAHKDKSVNRGRELNPFTNLIDIYVYNQTDPSEHYEEELNLATDPPYVSIPVTSDGPYTVEVYASHHDNLSGLNFCLTAMKMQDLVPGGGTKWIEPTRVDYAEITAPAATVIHGNVLNMVGDLRVPVDIAQTDINWIFVEFNTIPNNSFYLEPVSYVGFTKDIYQRLDFSQSVITTYPLGAPAVFNCTSIGIDFNHPVLGKSYVYFYWNPGVNPEDPDDPENPLPLYTVTVNP